MNNQNKIRGLPPDLWPRRVGPGLPLRALPEQGYVGSEIPMLPQGRVPPPYSLNTLFIGRGFNSQLVTVGTTATQLMVSEYSWPYVIFNPSRNVGLTVSGTIFDTVVIGAIVAAGNTEATPIGVANYLNMHFHINGAVVGLGTLDVFAVTRNPVTGTWADSQVIFSLTAASPTNNYGFIAMLGVAVDFAVRWEITAGTTFNGSLAYTLKDGLPGASSGLAKTVYLASNPGVSIVSGFPLLEGGRLDVLIGENVELWGIAPVPVPINIFKL